MKATKLEGWVRVGDEQFTDCLVGNRKGLEGFKAAIEDTLSRDAGSTELSSYTDADIAMVVLSEAERAND